MCYYRAMNDDLRARLSYPWPSLAFGKLSLLLTALCSKRAGPDPQKKNCTWERWPQCCGHRRAGATAHMGEGRQPDMITCTTIQAHIQVLGLAHPNIYPMTYWSMWRDLSCWMIPTGSLKFGVAMRHLRWVWLRFKWWWCDRNQCPWNRPMIHCNEYLQVKLTWQRFILHGTM